MAKQTINIGTAPNDGTGTPLRTAFDYCNLNFTELYTAVGPSGNNIVVPGTATITGDLTVDTSTFKVNSGNNNVGIGFAGNASSGRLQISQPLGSTIDGALRLTDDATTSFVFNNVSSGLSAIWSSGSIAFGVGSGTFTEAMRLNSTGLGVGVVPSAWQSNFKAFELGRVGNAIATYTAAGGAADLYISSNAYYNGGFKYANSSQTAGLYSVTGNVHAWFTAASGTAGNAITDFATAKMTLDASGNLLVGTTSGSFRGQFAVASGADRNVFTAQVTGASNGFQVLWNHATTTTRVIIANIPTSSAGLAAGTLWNDAGTIKIA
jgi:hypothetical protein